MSWEVLPQRAPRRPKSNTPPPPQPSTTTSSESETSPPTQTQSSLKRPRNQPNPAKLPRRQVDASILLSIEENIQSRSGMGYSIEDSSSALLVVPSSGNAGDAGDGGEGSGGGNGSSGGGDGMGKPIKAEIPLSASYEYLDHTADIQLHSWGPSLKSALESLALSMFNYITPLTAITINEDETKECGGEVDSAGHDLDSLVYSFLGEWLFRFNDTGFIPNTINITEINIPTITSFNLDGTEKNDYTIRSSGEGECFELGRHEQGTEVKAITYSNMQVLEREERWDVYVIVDI